MALKGGLIGAILRSETASSELTLCLLKICERVTLTSSVQIGNPNKWDIFNGIILIKVVHVLPFHVYFHYI